MHVKTLALVVNEHKTYILTFFDGKLGKIMVVIQGEWFEIKHSVNTGLKITASTYQDILELMRDNEEMSIIEGSEVDYEV